MTVQDVRFRLDAYRIALETVEAVYSRLDAVEARSKIPRTTLIDGMPHAKGHQDKISSDLAFIDELRQEAEAAENEADRVRCETEKLIDLIPSTSPLNVRRHTVLTLRYIDLLSWKKIADAVHGQKMDFCEKKESYLRSCSKDHKKAIQIIASTIGNKASFDD